MVFNPRNKNLLTPKQQQVLEFIAQEIKSTGRSPTYRAIAAHFGLKAIGTVQDHIAKLLELGFLQKEENPSRGLKLPVQTPVSWIPLLGRVPAGTPLEAIQEEIQHPEKYLPFIEQKSGEYFALTVQGDSMIGKGILEGDILIVRKQAEAQNGEIVVALVDQEATVKTLEKKKGSLRLLPANPLFEPIELNADRNHLILGKVVAVQRKL